MHSRLGLTVAAIAAVLASLTVGLGHAHAAEPSEIRVLPLSGLIRGFGFEPHIGGTWYQAPAAIRDGILEAEITVQLPAVEPAAELGPLVALWQLRVTASDKTHGDLHARLIGPPHAVAVLPNCDRSGNCAARFVLAAPTDGGFDAADLEWSTSVGIGISLTVIRTFNDGALLQGVVPQIAADADGGTVAAPSDTYGALNLSPLIPADDAVPAEILGEEFFVGSDEAFDWAAAVQAALDDFDSPGEPEPVPINVWTPDQQAADRILLRISFDQACPMDRFVVIRSAGGGEVAFSMFLGGAQSARADVALPPNRSWDISLQAGDGTTLNATGLEPLGLAEGLEVGGSLDCLDGKGLITQEPIPIQIPNPSGDRTPEPDPTEPGPNDSTGQLLVAGTAALLVLGFGVYAFSRRRRT